MSPWFGKTAFMIGIVAMMIIRGPHGRRSGKIRIVESRKGGLEITLLALMWIATLILPLISMYIFFELQLVGVVFLRHSAKLPYLRL